MENVVSIIKSRDNELEFDISIQGVDDEGTQVRFVIDASPAALVFNCTHKEDDKWVVTVPPMPQIEAMTYEFHIEIVVGGYFFTPFKGTINVTNEPEVKSSAVGAPVSAPVVSATIKVNGEAPETEAEEKEEETEEKEVEVVVKAEVEEEAEEKEEEAEDEDEKEEKEEDAKPIPDEYADLADSLIKNHKKKKAKETEQGKKVKEVLKDLEKGKKEKKDDEPKEKEEKEEKPKKKAAKKKAAPKKKKKEEKVEESSPFTFGKSGRTSTLSSVIDDFMKPAVVDEQAQKVQDILKNL